MDFSQPEEQHELAALTRKILTGLTPQRLREAEAGPDRFDPVLWAALGSAGVLAATLPAAAGGDGLGLLAQCSVLTELGRAVAPVPYLPSIVLGAGALARFGSGAQQRRWARPAAHGEFILTAALAEEDGDDPAAPATRAEPDRAGGWRLTGVKTTVPAAPQAGLMLVPAAAPEGVRVFLVSPADGGVTIERQRLSSGESAGRVVLDAVPAGPERVLGADRVPGADEVPGADGVAGGAAAAEWLVSAATVGLCALQAGVTERALELTAEYARTRTQFGKPIGGFQAVAQRLADAHVDVAAIRLTMWQAAWRLSEGLPCGTEVATAKFWAADAGHRVAHTAVHVHGGVGIDLEYPLHRYFTAAKHNEFTLGGATTHLRRLGAALAQA
jgi:acyl-CoA dehydrogenase